LVGRILAFLEEFAETFVVGVASLHSILEGLRSL